MDFPVGDLLPPGTFQLEGTTHWIPKLQLPRGFPGLGASALLDLAEHSLFSWTFLPGVPLPGLPPSCWEVPPSWIAQTAKLRNTGTGNRIPAMSQYRRPGSTAAELIPIPDTVEQLFRINSDSIMSMNV